MSGKVVTLLLLTTAARVSDVTALSTRVDFSVNDEQVIIYPDPEFRPKTMDDIYSRGPTVIKAFYPKPRNREQRRLNLSCLVRAVCIYLDRTRAVRQSEQLLVSYRKQSPGLPITPERVSHWLVDTVVEAYTRARKPVPKLTAHSTRGVSTSVAALSGLSWEVIRRTAFWKSDLTFSKVSLEQVRTLAAIL